jgi:hypothetical protein
MRYLLISGGVIVLLVAIVVAIGYSLPVKHHGTGDVTTKASPEATFALITNIDAFPTWRTGVTSAKMVPAADGRSRFREVSGNGTITYIIESIDRNHRVVTRIDDKTLPFGGTWTYDIVPTTDGRTTLRITEDGEIYNPVFRFVSRFFLGYDATIRTYLTAAQKKLDG